MFTGEYKEVTSVRLVAKGGAKYDIRLVKGDLHKFVRLSGREIDIKCSYGVSVGNESNSHEDYFTTKYEACSAFGRFVTDKLYAGYRFANAVK